MRLTQTILKEYLALNKQIEQIEARKQEIRAGILAQKKPTFTIGDYLVNVTAYERRTTVPMDELREIVGEKMFSKITTVTPSERITVKSMGERLKLALLAFMVLAVGFTTGGCATARTKWTDKSMRVMINPDGISAKHYVRIQQALVESGKWVVVDRGMGYDAIKKEQEREHREQTDRFLDSEKFAHWGKLYGVGGIVVAHAQCVQKDGIFKKNFPVCRQYLSIVDSNSGEVIAAVEDESEGSSYDYDLAPSWEDAVVKLNSAYPTHYEPNRDHKILRDYKELSKEEATRQREQLAREIAGKKE